MSGNTNNPFMDALALFCVFLQMADYQMNMQQSSNDDIMHELQKQNKMYFERIIENQEKIMSILSEDK